MQLTKEPLINSIEIAKSCIKIMALVIERLIVNKAECDAAMSSELHSAHEVHKLVQGGKHFRDAYLEVKNGW
jgi:argininosuccinate lyase